MRPPESEEDGQKVERVNETKERDEGVVRVVGKNCKHDRRKHICGVGTGVDGATMASSRFPTGGSGKRLDKAVQETKKTGIGEGSACSSKQEGKDEDRTGAVGREIKVRDGLGEGESRNDEGAEDLEDEGGSHEGACGEADRL